MFLGRIQRCYHKEREEKERKKKEYEDLVSQLEHEEMRMVEQLKNTQQLEQQIKVRNFQRPSSTAVSEMGGRSPELKPTQVPMNSSMAQN